MRLRTFRGAERVKRRKPGLRGRNSGAQKEVRNAIAHLFRGFVSESHGEDRFGGHAIGDQVGHAKCNSPCLAGSGAREDQHRALDGFDGQPLLGV